MLTLLTIIMIILQTMETRPVVPDRKLLARLVLIREEARNMMGGGILDERNDRGLNTLPESEVCFLSMFNILNIFNFVISLPFILLHPQVQHFIIINFCVASSFGVRVS